MNSRDNLANTGPLNRRFFNWFLTNAAEIVSIVNANSTDQLSPKQSSIIFRKRRRYQNVSFFFKKKQKRTVVVHVECFFQRRVNIAKTM